MLWTTSSGRSSMPSSARTPSTVPIWCAYWGCERSTTCSSRSASAASSRVAAEGGEEVVGQAVDEAHRVGEQDPGSALEVDGAGRGVEGGEELVLHEDVGAGQGPHEGRLAGVGVAHEGDAEEIAAALARIGHLRADAVQLALQGADPGAHEAAVDLELGLPGAAASGGPHAADGAAPGLARQVGPGAGEARQQVLELRQLDLHVGRARARVAGEDVEDDGAAVEDAHLRELLEVAHLGGGQVVVEEDHGRPAGLRQLAQLVGLSFADVVGGVDAGARLQHLIGHGQGCGVGQPGELVEGILHFPSGHARQGQADEEGGLSGRSGGVSHAGTIPGPRERCQAPHRCAGDRRGPPATLDMRRHRSVGLSVTYAPKGGLSRRPLSDPGESLEPGLRHPRKPSRRSRPAAPDGAVARCATPSSIRTCPTSSRRGASAPSRRWRAPPRRTLPSASSPSGRPRWRSRGSTTSSPWARSPRSTASGVCPTARCASSSRG